MSKYGIPWPVFPESSSVASRYVVNTKPTSKAEAPGQVSRPFSQEDGGVEGGGGFRGSIWCLFRALPRAVYPIVSVPWEP